MIVLVVNLWRRLVNSWRHLWRRRVDFVRVTLRGGIAEFSDATPRWRRMLTGEDQSWSVERLRRLFERVQHDPHAQGVILRIDGLHGGWATLQSVRSEIAFARNQGSRVVAHLFTADVAGYYVACACDSIVMPPSALWNVVGVRAEVQFLRDALARYGIEVEAIAVSPYKAAPDTLTRTDFSPESRAQFERMLDARFDELLSAIAAARALDKASIQGLIDRAPLAAPDALAAHLADALCYDDDIDAWLAGDNADLRVADWADARHTLRLPPARFLPRRIGLIRVEGTITRGSNRVLPVPIPLLGNRSAGSDALAQAVRQAERNPRVAAVVVAVNSPGGDAYASDLMWREILRLRRQKPVVVAMGDTAASGGYYLAAPASAIVAQPATLTGSIGVFVMRPVAAGLLEQYDVHTTVLSRGANSGLLGSLQRPTDGERAALNRLVWTLYDMFRERVRSGRDLSDEQLEPLAGGRVWLGTEAHERGLVDGLGGIPEAVAKAQELAGLPTDRSMPLVALSGGRSSLAPLPFPADEPIAMQQAALWLLQPRAWALQSWAWRGESGISGSDW
ncbi:MAG TPA: S49 family peptidase [Roseiflexaceae bacterium]|nr:S49 family peptidase [Roseiflexaceae bacterium]